MFDVASPRVNGDGSFAGFIGSAIDITDQKLAQDALEKVGGRLIEAQERERSRIARDLHDDICQRLAILSVELEQANRNGVPPSTRKKLEEIGQQCAEIAGDIQSLSHELHSSKLDYLGLVEGTRAFCDELSNQFEVNVRFRSDNVPRVLPKDVSLCLFRIMQEALHNALKYSGVREFEVDLRGTGGEVQLEVRDSGVGFEVEVAKRGAGLGLVSMQERVHVVHGQLRVESKPEAGTRVIASVPMIAALEGSSREENVWRMAV
jgi:signal transduction histidine kinase